MSGDESIGWLDLHKEHDCCACRTHRPDAAGMQGAQRRRIESAFGNGLRRFVFQPLEQLSLVQPGAASYIYSKNLPEPKESSACTPRGKRLQGLLPHRPLP